MKRKYSIVKDKDEGALRSRSRQRVLSTPEESRGSSQEPAVTHDQEMSTAPPAISSETRPLIAPRANVTPSEDRPALKAPAPEPSPQPKDTSSVAEAFAHLPIEASTSEIIEGVGAHVVDITTDVKVLETQSQEVDEKQHDKAITTS